ncbi:MAG: hypothetical protein JJE44_13365 [Flavobacteriaceae bacterium]|nr:hypothetical protein [Flavobacteriaceae bacterium]
MKNKVRLSVFLIALGSTFLFGQQKCDVLKVDISGEYLGDCKNGLAHGKGLAKGQNKYEGEFKKGLPNGVGTIFYSDGGKYVGEWKDGLRQGEGKYIINIKGKDSIAEGIWNKDKYKGKKPVKQYEVIKKTSVSRYSIKKIGDATNKVTIKVRAKGQALKNIEDITASDGNKSNYEGYLVYENINSFPFQCQMRYSVPSALGTASVNVEFSFKIFETGEWLVELNH